LKLQIDYQAIIFLANNIKERAAGREAWKKQVTAMITRDFALVENPAGISF